MTEIGSGGSSVPLKSLKSKRSQIKSQSTRVATYLESAESRNASLIELRQRLHRFSETWDIFNGVQSAIEDIEESPEHDARHNKERASFEEKYFAITSELESLIENRLSALPGANLSQIARQVREGTPATYGSGGNDHLKLPRVNLPTFSGVFDEWIPFRNMFNSMIHQNAALPNTQKMQYLIASLKGEARDVIGSLEVAEENYVEAWDMLKERYDDNSMIIQKHIRSMFEIAAMALGRPTDQWDDLIIYLITSRLDQRTSRAWEITINKSEVPTLKRLTDFLAQHCKALEASTRAGRPLLSDTKQKRSGQTKSTAANLATVAHKCAYCEKAGHSIYKCENYLQLEISERIKEARARKLCLCCLKAAVHQAKQCTFGPCRKCNKRHNTLLHMEQASTEGEEIKTKEVATTEQNRVVATSVNSAEVRQDKQVLLATAIVKVRNSENKEVSCRALLDSGSQSCFMTNDCAKRLSLKQFSTKIPVCGLGAMSTQANRRVRITVQSRINNFKANIECLVIERITQPIPLNRIKASDLQIPEGISLADPEFRESTEVDLLLGAEIFFEVMCIGRIKVAKEQPNWQKTLFGWVVSGNLLTKETSPKTLCHVSINERLSSEISRFWQVESCEKQNTRSPEERKCEAHFERTYRRNADGRFVVSLPIKEEQLRQLGDSKESAVQRFLKLEKRLAKQPKLKLEYAKFMQEYAELGHMREVLARSDKGNLLQTYYLPHHCVLKEMSATTRIRVVFDASNKSTSGVSLNEVLMKGPVLQEDLFSILTRFRSFRYVITSDITKMYRQVLIEENQASLQRIVWLNDKTEDIKTYQLLTLTYGTTPASFIATKAIHQLAELERNKFPVGAAIAQRDFYMDDLLTGANSIEEARTIRDQIAKLLMKGGFVLRKWASNSKELLQDLPGPKTEVALMELDKDDTSKTLGIRWNHSKDSLQYAIGLSRPRFATKRTIMSNIAQIFDPLGLLAPVIITAKLLIQELWKLQVEWDESLPTEIFTKWADYVEEMQCLDEFRIPRQVIMNDTETEIQLHGFCDASERAYGACVYVRSIRKINFVQVSLIGAKSRVAPIKVMSIPKLELCGAQLLARLMCKIKASLVIKVAKSYYWTDSSIVLCWLKSTKKLPVFVAHRVGEIQESTAAENWRHVDTKENPADLVSRGINPSQLQENQLWWNGPDWLSQPTLADCSDLENGEEEELSGQSRPGSPVVMVAVEEESKCDLVHRYSTLQKLLRITATCLRFVDRCRKKQIRLDSQLTVEELERAKRCIVEAEQLSVFRSEIESLRRNKAIANNSKLRHLNPWLDGNGLLRVGGRLRYSVLDNDTKYPLVLPAQSKFAELVILQEHTRHFHAGAEATLAAVRQSYWPLKARSLVKSLIYKCIKCFRFTPRNSEQIMGNLPYESVVSSRPFSNIGMDLCGPIYIREGRRRGAKNVKAYVVVFVCLAVKAIHLEVVSDLTTDAFLNAFKRFIGRRGKPSNVYSDNGTNLVGANRQLEELRGLFHKDQKNRILDYSLTEGIKWNFIPPRAPHFGGLWERAVRSFKTHFYKVASDVSMTFEEASTLTSQIEAILNSRPLTALSADPNDLSFLSPGHFLIGDTLTSYPEVNVMEVKVNRLSRWQLIERMRQHFWKRWSAEYLMELQRRNKWAANTGPQIKTGQLILCREDGLPPLKWALGRVKAVFPGADGVVRAAMIKTATGEYKRPAAKLCVLPIEGCTLEDCNNDKGL